MEERVTFEIKDRIGVIAEEKRGWKKELDIVTWNEGVPKFDIRSWDSTHERMTKGLTLTEDEARLVLGLLMKHFGKAEPTAHIAEDNRKEFILSIIDLLDDFLEEKGVKISGTAEAMIAAGYTPEEAEDNTAVFFGEVFDELYSLLDAAFKAWKVM